MVIFFHIYNLANHLVIAEVPEHFQLLTIVCDGIVHNLGHTFNRIILLNFIGILNWRYFPELPEYPGYIRWI